MNKQVVSQIKSNREFFKQIVFEKLLNTVIS